MNTKLIEQVAIDSEVAYEFEGKLHGPFIDSVDIRKYVERFAEAIVRRCADAADREDFCAADAVLHEFGLSRPEQPEEPRTGPLISAGELHSNMASALMNADFASAVTKEYPGAEFGIEK